MDAVYGEGLVALVPAEGFVDEGCVHSESSDSSELLESHSVDTVCETFPHSSSSKESKVSTSITLSVFMRSDQFMELKTDVLIIDGSRTEFGESAETDFWGVWVLFQQPSR